MARDSHEARALIARWQEDPAKLGHVRSLLEGQDRPALLAAVARTKDGMADLRGLTCKPCAIAGLDLNRVDLSFASIEGSIVDVDLSGSRLWGATLANSVIYGTWIRDAELAGADFSNSLLTNMDLTSSNLYAASFVSSRIAGMTLFDDVCLTGASFDSATVSNWWRRASLRHTTWDDATLEDILVADSDLTGVDFSKAHTARITFVGKSIIDLGTLASMDFRQTSFGPDSVDITAALRLSGDPGDRSLDIALLKTLVTKALEVGRHELADIFYYYQRTLEVSQMPYSARWMWEWFRGWLSGWGTQPGKTVRAMAIVCGLFAILYFAISAWTGESGLYEPDARFPITRGAGSSVRQAAKACCDVAVFSLGTMTRVSFGSANTEGVVAATLLLRAHVLEPRGLARRCAALEWIAGKVLTFLILEALLRRYWY